MTTEKKRVRIKKGATNLGGRPRTDLKDPFSDELIQRVPIVKSDSLVNEVAKEYWNESCKLLIVRKQLKRNHLPILVQMCNAFAITVMSDSELMKSGYLKQNPDTGVYTPAKHTVIKTYTDILLRCMAILRLDPKTELYNALAEKTEKGQYIDQVQEIYNEF